MKSLKKRIARRIGRWLAAEDDYKFEPLIAKRNGTERANLTFRSLRDLRWFERFLALQRNPLGRRVIQWLIRAGAGDDPQPPSAASRRMTSL